MAKGDNRVAFWQRWLLRLAVWLIILWGKTLRVRIAPCDQQAFRDLAGPVVFTFWHNHLLAVLMSQSTFKRRNPLAAVVSHSRDGTILSELFSGLQISTLRGSRYGRASAVVKEAIGALRKGHDLAITPDGSRGPIYEFKGGAATICRIARCPVVLIGGRFHASWRFRSWDGLFVPIPFSRVDYQVKILDFSAKAPHSSSTPGARELERGLLSLCGEKVPPPNLRIKEHREMQADH